MRFNSYGCLIRLILASLSLNNTIHSCLYAILLSNSWNQTASCASDVTAAYSASVDDNPLTRCFLPVHDTNAEPNKKANPEKDEKSSVLAQDASQYLFNMNLSVSR